MHFEVYKMMIASMRGRGTVRSVCCKELFEATHLACLSD